MASQTKIKDFNQIFCSVSSPEAICYVLASRYQITIATGNLRNVPEMAVYG